jgi:hypothetical protein
MCKPPKSRNASEFVTAEQAQDIRRLQPAKWSRKRMRGLGKPIKEDYEEVRFHCLENMDTLRESPKRTRSADFVAKLEPIPE